MTMKFIAATGIVLLLAAAANAGGMPPEAEIDANGVPVGVVEPVEAVTTVVANDVPINESAPLVETRLATAALEAPPAAGKDHR